MAMLTNEQFLQKLQDLNIPYIPLEPYKGRRKNMKWLCYKNHTHIFMSRPEKIYIGQGCPICSNHQVLKGYNDLWTTNPEIAGMLLNQDEGYLYTSGSKHKTDWNCLNCGNIIKDKSINEVTKCGLSCNNCSDGISYPEKFMMSVLKQLNIEYKFQLTKTTFEWCGKYKYDFYLPNYNMIIETHGEQHYFNNGMFPVTVEEQKKIDKEKMSLAISNGVEYKAIDCRHSNCIRS